MISETFVKEKSDFSYCYFKMQSFLFFVYEIYNICAEVAYVVWSNYCLATLVHDQLAVLVLQQ